MTFYAERLANVREQMEKHGVELLVLTPSPYMYYVSGVQERPFFGTLKGPGDWLNSLWIGLDGDPLFLVHWMVYRILARNPEGVIPLDADVRVVEHEDDASALLRETMRRFEPHDGKIAVADRSWALFVEEMRAHLSGDVEIGMASELMDGLLAVKDADALRLLRKACAITDAMYADVLKFIRPGVTERDVKLEVEFQFRKHGADGVSFPASAVFARPNSHDSDSPLRLQPGDSIMFDVGCRYQGYCSDFGRSVFVGEPPPKYLALHETVLRAQRAGIDAMRPGQITCEELVPIVQGVLAEAGYPPTIPQVGHAIGMSVHEAPILLTGDKNVIQAGMTFTVEPTVRVNNWYSNRVEDIVHVTEDGVEYLTQFPRELHIID